MRRVAWTLAAGLLIAVAFLSPGCVETDTGNGVFEDYTHDADVIPDEGEGLLLGAAPGADDTEAGAGGPAFRPDALPACLPTNPQAEVLHPGTIPCERILSIAVETEADRRQIRTALLTEGVDADALSLALKPELFKRR